MLLIDPDHALRYTVCALVTIEAARICWWLTRHVLLRKRLSKQLAGDVERLRLQVNRLQQTLDGRLDG